MLTIWKRGTLAAVVAASLSGYAANAEQPKPQCATTNCADTQIPGGAWKPLDPPAEQWPHTQAQETPPWQPLPPPHVPSTDPTPKSADPMPIPVDPKPTDPTPKDPTPSPINPFETDPSPTATEPMPTDPAPFPTDPGPVDPILDQANPADAMTNLSFDSAVAGIGSPDAAFGGAPNMMGDLLRAYRGVTFSYLQAGDFSIANTSGAVNFRNSKVAENNSAIPRDRVSFRYNYFKNALEVRGLDYSPELGPRLSQTAGSPIRQFHQVQPGTRKYDVDLYTLGFEKTFLNDMASIEVRVPFARTVDSSLNLVSGRLVSDVPNTVPLVEPTPLATLGEADTELQDMNVFLKAIVAQDPCQRWLVSAGLGLSIPTGEDFNVRVVDYSNDIPGDPGDLTFPAGSAIQQGRNQQQFAYDQRTRTFNIENSTWGLSPFLAGVYLPSENTFVNGFAQIELPLNSSDWRFRERDIDLEIQAQPSLGTTPVQTDRTLSGTIDDQILLNLDVGVGYWLYKNPRAKYVRGFAGLMELHYTSTLDDADIVVIPETPITTGNPGNPIGPLPPPRLGNIDNRLNILNYTVGGQVLVGRNVTVSTAYVVPLRDESDRTFDGELNVQLNVYR